MSSAKDDVTDEEEDFDEGTPPPSDDSGDEVGVVGCEWHIDGSALFV